MLDYRKRNISPLYSDVIRGRGGIAGGNFLWTNDETVTSYVVHSATARGSITYLLLSGASGTYASTPDAAALDIIGDIEIIVYVAADDNTPGTINTIVSKWVTTGNQRSFLVQILTNGILAISTSSAGTAGSIMVTGSTIAPGFTNGVGYWVKINVDVDNGAGGNTVTFSTSTNPVTTTPASIIFEQLGDPVINAGTTSIFNSNSALEIGAHSTGTAARFSGKIDRVLMYSGIGGTLAADFNANDGTVGGTSFAASATGETYTLNGAAAITAYSGINGIRLATTASSTNDAYNNMGIVLIGGTGSGQDHQRITDYDGASKVAVLSGLWTTEPDSTSVYQIINRAS